MQWMHGKLSLFLGKRVAKTKVGDRVDACANQPLLTLLELRNTIMLSSIFFDRGCDSMLLVTILKLIKRS